MYIPKAFEETRVPTLHALIKAQPFCSLITVGSSGLFASHLPMVLHTPATESAVLRGHLSRANTQWRDFKPDVQALAIFSGPQHYITPSWYEEKKLTGKVVPTWNYAVVHAYGLLEVIEDPDWLLSHLEALTSIQEAASATPWKVTDAPAEYTRALAKGIVGLELKIERLEGKWKLNQNRSEADRRAVTQGLTALDTPSSHAMAALMHETFESRPLPVAPFMHCEVRLIGKSRVEPRIKPRFTLPAAQFEVILQWKRRVCVLPCNLRVKS